jgi:resolvase, N domain protein
MKIGYIRVSTADQSEERQKAILEREGVDKIYIEKESGKNFEDREVYKMMKLQLREGDVLIFTSLDRFSRNTKETLKELEDLKEMKVKIKFIKEGIDATNKGITDLLINVFSWVAQQERETLLERQAEGYKALKRNEAGKMISKKGTIIGGKEKKLSNKQIELLKEYKNGKSNYNLSELARLINVSRPTIYKKLKEI